MSRWLGFVVGLEVTHHLLEVAEIDQRPELGAPHEVVVTRSEAMAVITGLFHEITPLAVRERAVLLDRRVPRHIALSQYSKLMRPYKTSGFERGVALAA